MMNPMDVAQYGIGFFAVCCLAAVVALVVKQYGGQKSQPQASGTTRCADHLSKVIENNTKAISDLTTVLQVSLATQGTKIDEILARARDN